VSDATNTGGTALGVPALMLAIAATGRADAGPEAVAATGRADADPEAVAAAGRTDADPEAVVVPPAHPAATAATAAARAAARKNLIRL
jgi:hypothetical protein